MNQVLGYVTPVRAYVKGEEIYMQAASGRVADALAMHYVYGPPPSPTDLPLESKNIKLVPQPYWGSSLGSLPHFFAIVRAYLRTCREADIIFVRGMCPYIGALYLFAFLFQRPVCHWIVGNPVALLQSSKRGGRLLDLFSLLYALQDRLQTRVGRWLTDGIFLCNGHELAQAYRSPRTVATVSSAIRQGEFVPRIDTCHGETIRILFVGYIRPEKRRESNTFSMRSANFLFHNPGNFTSWDRAIFPTIVASSTTWLRLSVSVSRCFGPDILPTVSLYLNACAVPIFSCCPACPKARRMCWSRPERTVYRVFPRLSEGCLVRLRMGMTPCWSLQKIPAPLPKLSSESFTTVICEER